MKMLLTASALAMLSACAMAPRTRDVPSQRIFVPLHQTTSSSASMTVVRGQGLYGAGCSSRLFVDGQLTLQMEQGEHITVPVSSGSHQLKLTHFGACASGSQELTAAPSAGQHISYRITANGRSMEAAKGS